MERRGRDRTRLAAKDRNGEDSTGVKRKQRQKKKRPAVLSGGRANHEISAVIVTRNDA